MRVDLLVPSLRFRIRVRSTIYHSSDDWETSEFPPTDQLNGCDDPAAVGLTPYPNLFFLFAPSFARALVAALMAIVDLTAAPA